MCIFSGEIEKVSNTRILAAADGPMRQAIAYQMDFKSAEDVAMILPIPVSPDPGNGDDQVIFQDMTDYPELFDDLHKPWHMIAKSLGRSISFGCNHDTLEVYKVGSFDASFVPTLPDMDRLDERFRLPKDIWGKLPKYASYGFVVFKFRKGEQTVHPMAFTFYTMSSELYFPTIHVHDRTVPKEAVFDHELFGQSPTFLPLMRDRTAEYVDTPIGKIMWRLSPGPAKDFVDAERAGILMDPEKPYYRAEIRGEFANRDVVIGGLSYEDEREAVQVQSKG